jgi:hypothetical protein
MSGFNKKKQSASFAKLFQVVSPEEFITIFNSELAQTQAFILSFSPRKSYVKKVLQLLDNKESDENNLMNRSSFIIREYLNRCQETNLNTNFVQAVEKEVKNIMAGYENFHDLRNLRRKLLFKHPKKVQVAQKTETETLEDKDKEFKSRFTRSYYG